MHTPQPETQSAADNARAKHTPGPWLIEDRPEHARGHWLYPEGRNQYVALACSVGSEQEDWANARLIAAAPDLLEALRNLKALFDCMGGPESGTVTFRCREVSPLYVAARAALAKAGV